jgi:hypothetical protein
MTATRNSRVISSTEPQIGDEVAWDRWSRFGA